MDRKEGKKTPNTCQTPDLSSALLLPPLQENNNISQFRVSIFYTEQRGGIVIMIIINLIYFLPCSYGPPGSVRLVHQTIRT